MIPVRLELQAFMPFKEKVSLDFRSIQTDRIFLITGNTGSGKTALFDAICFALYGVPSGSERNPEDLKSQFAGDDIETYVDFTFQNKGKTYRIRRAPTQNKLRRNGNVTPEAASAVLTTEDGKVYSKISEVNDKIIKILGLTVSQFKKIVMLPQGEFRKFLNDSSKEKQEILRRIFETEIFDQFTEEIHARYNELSLQTKTIQAKLLSYTAQINAGQDEQLKALLSEEYKNYPQIIQHTAELNRLLLNQAEEENAVLALLQKEYGKLDLSAAEQFNQKIARLEQAKTEYQHLLAQSETILKEKQQIRLLENVKDSQHIFSRKKELTASIDKLQKELAENLHFQTEIEQQFQQLEVWYQKELAYQQNSSEQVRRIDQAKQQLTLFADRAKLKRRLDEIEAETARLKLQYHSFRLNQNSKECDAQKELLNDIAASIQAVQEADRVFLQQAAAYEQAFHTFLSGQAYQLSLQLKPGISCPVCGSKEHPSPAKKAKTIKEDDLNDQKAHYETASQQLKSAKLKLEVLLEKAKTAEMIPQDYQVTSYPQSAAFFEESLKKISEKQQEISAQLSKLKEHSNVLYLSMEESDFSEKLGEYHAQKINAEEQLRSLSDTILKNKLIEKELQETINQKTQELEQHHADFISVSKQRSECQTKKDQYAKTIELIQKQQKELSKQLGQIQAQCHETISRQHYTEEQFYLLLDTLDTLPQKKATVSQWEQECLIKKELISNDNLELQGKSPVDLEAMKIHQKQLKEKIQAQTDHVQSILTQYHLNDKMLCELKQEYQKSESLSKQYDELNRLYLIASGKNKDRISFERYVLGIYFDQVIRSANTRLLEMTNSRYFLRRRDIREKGNASSGLELEIFDAHNGKFRHVNTLSGGESFKTALALALGLADVITQKSGGIEINTIFIDEGFGTLDEEALDSAIDCLFQIKESGRYIGIISHVTELKEKIPTKLKVFQSKEGSSAKFESDDF